MNLVYGEVVDVFAEDAMPFGRIRVRRALTRVPLALVPDAKPGDAVLICDGVAIGRVEKEELDEKESA